MMETLDIPYAFEEYEGQLPDRYFAGEYQEQSSDTKEESGYQYTTFYLNGFTRGSRLLLEKDREKVESYLPKTLVLDDGTGLAVYYETSQVIPTDDAELKRVEIILRINEWKVIK
jgi:hypothetical protein